MENNTIKILKEKSKIIISSDGYIILKGGNITFE